MNILLILPECTGLVTHLDYDKVFFSGVCFCSNSDSDDCYKFRCNTRRYQQGATAPHLDCMHDFFFFFNTLI